MSSWNWITEAMRECINYANVRHVLGADFPLTLLTFDQAEVDGKLGRDLLDEVAGEVAGGEGDILHQEEDGIRQLGQLALAQVCKEGRHQYQRKIIICQQQMCPILPISDIFSVHVPGPHDPDSDVLYTVHTTVLYTLLTIRIVLKKVD